MLDDIHLRTLLTISNGLTPDNIGDAMVRAIVLKSTMQSLENHIRADEIMDKIRAYARSADTDWKVFEQPIEPKQKLKDLNIWQLIGAIGALFDLHYCFERIEEAGVFTFENSAPVRFYLNGIFHYLTALFLLDKKDNLAAGFPRPGTMIKILHPIGMSSLLDPIYQVFDRPFGETKSYGDTILRNRNRQFVHGSFSPKDIRSLVKDTNIFDEGQKLIFMLNHRDIFDRVVVLRLQLISVLNGQEIDPAIFSPSKLYNI